MNAVGVRFTAVVFARNEHRRLPLILDNLRELENVLVVDNFSTDDTCEIARSYGRNVVRIRNEGGFVETPAVMDQVLGVISTEYILICVCAEFYPAKLLRICEEISNAETHDVLRIDRISISGGVPVPIDFPPRLLRSMYAGEVRFFRKGTVDYNGNLVHGRGRIVAPAARVRRVGLRDGAAIVQFRDYDSIETEMRHTAYNDIVARQIVRAGKKYGITKGLLYGIKVFFVRYILYGGIRYGWVGFMHCYYRFHMQMSIAFRVHELKTTMTKSDLQKMNDHTRAAMNSKESEERR